RYGEGLRADHRGVVALPLPILPLLRELVERPPVDGPYLLLECPVLPQVPVDLVDAPVAVGGGEVTVDRATQRIDDPARGVGQIAERRQPARDREVAQHHLVPRVLTRREELRQALRPPQRQ